MSFRIFSHTWLLGMLAPWALWACSPSLIDASPALWRIEDAQGHVGWLFGTIHSSDRPLNWLTPSVDQALTQSHSIMVEVANLADDKAVGQTFTQLARSDAPQPPLTERIAPKDRAKLTKLLKKSGHKDTDFSAIDTWAAALILARGNAQDSDVQNGVDRAVMERAGTRPIVELEGAGPQLTLFDTLPEKEQRDLLAAVVAEVQIENRDLAASWRAGDMKAIEAETRTGLLADPELRAVLFTGRNKAWTNKIVKAVQSGEKPFVAVGAAHMAGTEGLPAMLKAQGFRVTRIN